MTAVEARGSRTDPRRPARGGLDRGQRSPSWRAALGRAARFRPQGLTVPAGRPGFTPAGANTLTVDAGDRPLRAVLIVGEPLNERILMWWNFVGRTHEEVVAFREQ